MVRRVLRVELRGLLVVGGRALVVLLDAVIESIDRCLVAIAGDAAQAESRFRPAENGRQAFENGAD